MQKGREYCHAWYAPHHSSSVFNSCLLKLENKNSQPAAPILGGTWVCWNLFKPNWYILLVTGNLEAIRAVEGQRSGCHPIYADMWHIKVFAISCNPFSTTASPKLTAFGFTAKTENIGSMLMNHHTLYHVMHWQSYWQLYTGEKQWFVKWVNCWAYVDWRHYCSMTFVQWIKLKYIQKLTWDEKTLWIVLIYIY